MDPQQRTTRARLAAHVLHSRYDSRDLTKAGRAKFMERFEDEVDPERRLPEEERLRRAAHAKKAYFTRLALKRSRSSSPAQSPAPDTED